MNAIRIFFAPIFVVAVATSQAFGADAVDPHAADREALLKVFHEIEAGINDQNIDRMIAQMTPDATVIWLSGDISRGHEEIRAYYNRVVKGPERILDKYTTKATLGVKARFYGTVAVADGSMQDSFYPVSRKPFELSSKWTSTCAKIDGQWKVVSLHLSTGAFKNTLLDEAKAAAKTAAVGGVAGGLLLAGLLCWWRGRRKHG